MRAMQCRQLHSKEVRINHINGEKKISHFSKHHANTVVSNLSLSESHLKKNVSFTQCLAFVRSCFLPRENRNTEYREKTLHKKAFYF